MGRVWEGMGREEIVSIAKIAAVVNFVAVLVVRQKLETIDSINLNF